MLADVSRNFGKDGGRALFPLVEVTFFIIIRYILC